MITHPFRRIRTHSLSLFARAWRRGVSIVLALIDHAASLKAAAMAFDAFLGLLPLAAILGWVLATFAQAQIRNSIISSLMEVAPGPAAALVEEQLRRLVERGGTIAPLSALGFIWVASAGAHTAMGAVQEARLNRTRPWPLNRLISILVVIALLVIVTGATTVYVFVETKVRAALAAGHIEVGWAVVARSATFLASVAIASIGCAAFFHIATWGMEAPRRRVVWPGAVAASTMWMLMSWVFGAYVKRIGSYSVFYGSLAAVALFLIWLWLSCFLVLVGSELNLQLEGGRDTIVPPKFHILPKPLRPKNGNGKDGTKNGPRMKSIPPR